MRRPENIEHLYLDFDGFFASVEQLRDPALRGRPIGIVPYEGGRTCIIACSREAKAVLVKTNDGDEHCLIYYGCNRIHLHVIDGTLLEGPVILRFDIGWFGAYEPAILTLRRFLHLCRSGEIFSDRPVSDRMRHRAILMLRIHDALAQGASIRDVGIMLFGLARIEAEWRDPGESLKSQCRRLIASARAMAAGGYKDFLR